MADETKDPSTETNTPPDGGVALSVETGTGEVELTPEQIEKQEEHKERSRLGRRVSAMEQMVRDRDVKIDDLLNRIDNMVSPSAPPSYNEDGSDYVTKKDIGHLVVDALQKNNMAVAVEDRKYQTSYRNKLGQLGLDSDDSDFHAKVVAELEDPKSQFNVRPAGSNDAYGDAERNYLKASLHLLKTGKPTNPLKGGKLPGPIGVGGDSKIKDKEPPMPKLTKEAAQYAESMGLTADQVKKYLE